MDRADRGFCPKHRKAYYNAIDRNRLDATSRGYDARWKKLRDMFLRDNPLCACGCGCPAEEVHHLIPVKDRYDPRFFEVDNLAGLTKACHSRETMRMLNERKKR